MWQHFAVTLILTFLNFLCGNTILTVPYYVIAGCNPAVVASLAHVIELTQLVAAYPAKSLQKGGLQYKVGY
jgi:hypothetical protein